MSEEFISLRDVRLSSKTGHVALMTANVARTLPQELHMEARTNGCVPVTEAKVIADSQEKQEPTEEQKRISQDRANDIKSAIELLIASNDPAHFNAHNKPKVKSVEEIVGYDVSAPEVREVFNAMKAD